MRVRKADKIPLRIRAICRRHSKTQGVFEYEKPWETFYDVSHGICLIFFDCFDLLRLRMQPGVYFPRTTPKTFLMLSFSPL